MEIENYIKMIINTYDAMLHMDNYSLKEYVLKNIDNYLNEYVVFNKYDSNNINKLKEDLKSVELKVKLQDSLIILNKINVDMELIFLIKEKLANLV